MGNSTLAIRVLPEEQRTLAFGSIGAAYAKVGAPLNFPALQLIFQNGTDKDVTFSWDGFSDAFTVFTRTSFVLDVQSNKGPTGILQVAQGTQFWVKQVAAPGSGSVYISSFYGANFNNL